jgi:hypothetical protein
VSRQTHAVGAYHRAAPTLPGIALGFGFQNKIAPASDDGPSPFPGNHAPDSWACSEFVTKQAAGLCPCWSCDTQEGLAMSHPLPSPGGRFREVRKSLRLTLRDVARQSAAIAREQGSSRFQLSATNLHGVENKRQVPTLHHLYRLARIHGLDLGQVFSWYLEANSGPGTVPRAH